MMRKEIEIYQSKSFNKAFSLLNNWRLAVKAVAAAKAGLETTREFDEDELQELTECICKRILRHPIKDISKLEVVNRPSGKPWIRIIRSENAFSSSRFLQKHMN